MSFIQNYRYENYSNTFECPDADLEMTITNAKETQSSSGKQMLEVTFDVAMSNGVPYIERYVEGEWFNRNISRFFDAFKIDPDTIGFEFSKWIGKKGLGKFRHVESSFIGKEGNQVTTNKAELHYLIVDAQNQQSAPQQNQNIGYAHQGTNQAAQAQSNESQVIQELLNTKTIDGNFIFMQQDRVYFNGLITNGTPAAQVIEIIKQAIQERNTPKMDAATQQGASQAFDKDGRPFVF